MKNRILVSLIPLLIAFPLQGHTQARERILVLGFDSIAINEVQERLLRESVMKECIASGYQIIPVMRLEALVQEIGVEKIRKVTREHMKEYCMDIDADVAIAGKLYPAAGVDKKDGFLDQKKSYCCAITVYIKAKDTWRTAIIETTGEEDIAQFVAVLSKKIAAAVKDALLQ